MMYVRMHIHVIHDQELTCAHTVGLAQSEMHRLSARPTLHMRIPMYSVYV